MNKLILVCIVITFATSSFSQKGIDAMVQAERNFASYSIANDTKSAFLNFADSLGIMFDNGRPVNAIEVWNKREKRPGKLYWRPQYATIASSGDFGYTTGPWEFSLNDTIRVIGNFVTVWHLDEKTGQWKFLIDLGVSRESCDTAAVFETLKSSAAVDSKNKGSVQSLISAEEKLIADYDQKGKSTYSEFLSDYSIIHRNKRCLIVSPEAQKAAIESTPSKIQYTINGTGISPSGDLGYVYGTTNIDGKTENYVRIWRKEKAGWKIGIEVLRY